MRIAVTGTKGQVVQALLECAPTLHVEVLPVGRPELDLLEPETIGPVLRACTPDVIVSAAAYTAVDKAESEAELAYAINARGAGAVAYAAATLGIPVVHLSTDYVFAGDQVRPYVEEDPPGPIGIYGSSKLAGEVAVANATPNHAILRTAWVYSPFGTNFVRTMLRLAQSRERVRVVADQHGSPTSAHDVANAIVGVCENLIQKPHSPELRGIFHMTGAGDTTWAGFADAIFSASAACGGPTAIVDPIPASAYPTFARRPANSRLNGMKLEARHGITLPDWRTSTKRCVARLVEELNGSSA